MSTPTLTHHPEVLFSQEALRRAWQHVRRNGNASGADRVTPSQFEARLETELDQLRRDILAGSYQPRSVRRYYVLKASGKKRPLTIWAVRDRVAQRVVLDYITPPLEAIFLECSYGFRPGRKREDALDAVLAARRANRRWVVDADIKDCFDSIPIPLLMAQVRSLLPSQLVVHLIELWLNAPVEARPGQRAGVSQGGVISPPLTNLYLHRFDQTMTALLPETRLIRFADDFVLLCRHKLDAAWALKVVRNSLASLRLRLNMEKTRILDFDTEFTFLGVLFRGGKPISADNTPSTEES